MCVCIAGPALCSEDEARLVKTMFTGYNKVVRPVSHFKDPVVVTVGLQLIQLISVVNYISVHFYFLISDACFIHMLKRFTLHT